MIELSGIKKSYNNICVLHGINLTLDHPSFTSLLGASGSGKTTLLRIIAGLESADEGTVSGVEAREVAYVFQEARLFPWLSAADNIACVIPCKRKEAYEKAVYWLECIGMRDDAAKLPAELSGGMRQRIAVARALASERKILLLDEAFKELDIETKVGLYELVKKKTVEKTVLNITHDRSEAEYFSHNLLFLDSETGLSRVI